MLYYEQSKAHTAPTGPHADYLAALEAKVKGASRRQIAVALLVLLLGGYIGWKELGGGALHLPIPLGSHVDKALRADSGAFFKSYLEGYSTAGSASGKSGAVYNDLMKAQLADRKDKGTALGTAIDAWTKPLITDKGAFKDSAASRRAFQTIHDSLRAGMRDAAK